MLKSWTGIGLSTLCVLFLADTNRLARAQTYFPPTTSIDVGSEADAAISKSELEATLDSPLPNHHAPNQHASPYSPESMTLPSDFPSSSDLLLDAPQSLDAPQHNDSQPQSAFPELAPPTIANPLRNQDQLADPNEAEFPVARDSVQRLPLVISEPPKPTYGIEEMPSGDGQKIERLPPTIQNLWNPGDDGVLPTPSRDKDKPSDKFKRRSRPSPSDLSPELVPAPQETPYREAPLHLSDEPAGIPVPPYNELPQSFPSPSDTHAPTAKSTVPSEPLSEFLPPTYHPPGHTVTGSVPRAYIPPQVSQTAKVVWAPWWDRFVGQACLLDAPTVPVNLQQLMNLSLRHSPTIELARIDVMFDCGTSKSKVDERLLQVAESYWQTYRCRGDVIVQERLYHDALEVHQQLRKLVGDGDQDLMILAESTARRRLAKLATAHAALRDAQNLLTQFVSIPGWEQERELLPQDKPFCRPYQVNEAVEIRNALGRRPEIRGATRRIRSASIHHGVIHQRVAPQWMPLHCAMPQTTIPVSYESPIGAGGSTEIEVIADQVKLDVKNAIVRIASTYELMHRYSNSAQAAAQEVVMLQSKCEELTGSDKKIALFFRDLLDAQEQLAKTEHDFLAAHTNYSAAILELRRANGSIIDQCSFKTARRVGGPGISNPSAAAVPQPRQVNWQPTRGVEPPNGPTPQHAGSRHTIPEPHRSSPFSIQPSTQSQMTSTVEDFQSPQESLDPSAVVPPFPPTSTPREYSTQPNGTFEPSPSRPIDIESKPNTPNPASLWSDPPVQRQPVIQDTPQRDLTIPREEDNRANGDQYQLPTPADEPFEIDELDDLGPASQIAPPAEKQRPSSRPSWRKLPSGNRRLPIGELPMPSGERMKSGQSFWQPGTVSPNMRSSFRTVPNQGPPRSAHARQRRF